MSERLEGRRAVLAALRAGRVTRVEIAEGARHAIVDEIRIEAERRDVPVEWVPRGRLDARSRTGKHQGVAAEAASRPDRSWDEVVAATVEAGEQPFVVALDGIQDPGNLGALVRSAAAFGAHVVLVPEDRASPVTEVAAKAAAGALEVVPVSKVASLQAAAERAKALGCWVVALAEEGGEPLETCALFEEPLFLVVGAEGRGVSRTLRAAADAIVAIPTAPDFPTLNASAAGAVAMYAVRSRRFRHG